MKTYHYCALAQDGKSYCSGSVTFDGDLAQKEDQDILHTAIGEQFVPPRGVYEFAVISLTVVS